MTRPHGLAINDEFLLASDAAYFRLAAEVVKLDGAHLIVNPKFAEIPAACVVTSVSKDVSDGPFSDWLSMVERSIRDYGFDLSRFYLNNEHPIAGYLEKSGYESRSEEGFSSTIARTLPSSGLSIQKLSADSNWEEKRQLHTASRIQSDGFEVSAERWVAFERAKCQTGRMTAYLARNGSRAVGTFCILEHRGYLRLKNLLVHPEARRQGVGERIIREALRLARKMELEGIVAFAVSDGPGEHLYRSAKMSQGDQVIEWRKSVVD